MVWDSPMSSPLLSERLLNKASNIIKQQEEQEEVSL